MHLTEISYIGRNISEFICTPTCGYAYTLEFWASPGRQMKDDFFNGLCRRVRGDFFNGPGRHMRGDFFNGLGIQMRSDFSNKPGQACKREMSLPTRREKKKIQINNIAGQSEPTKQRQSFQTGRKKNNNVSYLGDNICANKMCFDFFLFFN